MKSMHGHGKGNLDGCTVYLSGPMDFLALPREQERANGWRARVGRFLRDHGAHVLDPWNKPGILALHDYGKEDDKSTKNRERWTFGDSRDDQALRAEICRSYWPTVHIDLRMVDKSDFLIAFCPTNTYSVGTVHEIALARQQRKPVLFVSPIIPLQSLTKLEGHLARKGDRTGLELLKDLQNEQPMKRNLNGAPSLWYMGILSGDYFFDSFGFKAYRKKYSWKPTALDQMDAQFRCTRPLLPYLNKLDHEIPRRYDAKLKKLVQNDDWLIFEERWKQGG